MTDHDDIFYVKEARGNLEVSAPALLEKRYRSMRRLVDKYGVEGAQQALDQCIHALKDEERQQKAGRPKDYGVQQLMEVWLYIEEQAHKTGKSPSAVCMDREASFAWVTAEDGYLSKRVIKGATLRRRYQEARAFLKAQSKMREPKTGVTIVIDGAPVDPMSPVEKHWRKQLELRISAKPDVRKSP